MSENEINFGLFYITTAQLQSLPKSTRNFLIAASFISNDVRFQWSAMARSPIDSGDKYLQSMQLIRWLWGLRKLSSEVFEAVNAIDQFLGEIELLRKVNDSVGGYLSKNLRKSPCFAVVKELRNTNSYHYSNNRLDNELHAFSANEKHHVYATDLTGNSVSELSDKIHTFPLITSKLGKDGVEQLNKWSREASAAIVNFCNLATGELLSYHFPSEVYEEITLEVGGEMSRPENRWPLFLDLRKERVPPMHI